MDSKRSDSSGFAENHRAPPWKHGVPVVGLVGGVGCGKSAVARWVAEHSGWQQIDADVIGHDVLRQPAVIRQLVEQFGSDIVDSSGQIIRGAVAKQVFGNDPATQERRSRLEATVLPRIREEIRRRIEAAAATPSSVASDVRVSSPSVSSTSASPPDPAVEGVLLDAAILLETGLRDWCDEIVYVDVSIELREARVTRSRGWNREELMRREASQWPLVRKREAACFVLPNEGEISESGSLLLAHLRRRYGSESPD